MVATTKCHWPSLTGIGACTTWGPPLRVSQLSRPSAPTHKKRSKLPPPSPKLVITPDPVVLNHAATEKSSGSLNNEPLVVTCPLAPSNTMALEFGLQASGPCVALTPEAL